MNAISWTQISSRNSTLFRIDLTKMRGTMHLSLPKMLVLAPAAPIFIAREEKL